MTQVAQPPVQAAGPPRIILPRMPVAASTSSPNLMVIFAKPKVGKTTLLAMLKGCLILDLENGSDYVNAMKIKAGSIPDIKAIGDAILAEYAQTGIYPYQIIAVDTVSKLEEFCVPFALQLYRATPMGANFQGDDVRTLPQGAGWLYMRQAFEKVVEYLQKLAPKIILVGHIKDTLLTKEGKEFTSSELDLTGRLKTMVASNADAIAYMYRNKENQVIFNFKSSDEITCGARPGHLAGQEIVISEKIDEVIHAYWGRIFIDLPAVA